MGAIDSIDFSCHLLIYTGWIPWEMELYHAHKEFVLFRIAYLFIQNFNYHSVYDQVSKAWVQFEKPTYKTNSSDTWRMGIHNSKYQSFSILFIHFLLFWPI